MAGQVSPTLGNPLDGDLQNPIVRLAVRIADLEQELKVTKAQYATMTAGKEQA